MPHLLDRLANGIVLVAIIELDHTVHWTPGRQISREMWSLIVEVAWFEIRGQRLPRCASAFRCTLVSLIQKSKEIF